MSPAIVVKIILSIVPALGILLQMGIELPEKYQRMFFKFVPTWISSSIFSITIGAVLNGVTGPLTGFVSELVLFPGFTIIKKRLEKKDIYKVIDESSVTNDDIKKLFV